MLSLPQPLHSLPCSLLFSPTLFLCHISLFLPPSWYRLPNSFSPLIVLVICPCQDVFPRSAHTKLSLRLSSHAAAKKAEWRRKAIVVVVCAVLAWSKEACYVPIGRSDPVLCEALRRTRREIPLEGEGEFSDGEFRRLYRLHRTDFTTLFNLLVPHLPERGNSADNCWCVGQCTIRLAVVSLTGLL